MSTRLHIVVSDETVADIDRVRGDVPRSAWIRRLVMLELFGPASEQALGSSGRAGVRGRVPALPPAEQPGPLEDTFALERAAVREAVDAGATKVKVEMGSSLPRVRSSSEARPFRPVPKKGEK